MRRKAFTLIELLTVIAIISILVAILLPAVQAARESARSIQCAYKMKQIALAAHMHLDLAGSLPMATSNKNANRFQGWYAKLFPFLEMNTLSSEIDSAVRQTSDLFDINVHTHFGTQVPSLVCPSDPSAAQPQVSLRYRVSVGLTSYQGCSGIRSSLREGVLFYGSSVRFKEITDGLSHTILFGERPTYQSFDLGWWYAGTGIGDGTLEHSLGVDDLVQTHSGTVCDRRFAGFQKGSGFEECDLIHFWSNHSGGAWFAYVDGSVRFHPYSIDRQILNATSTRAGGESSVFGDN